MNQRIDLVERNQLDFDTECVFFNKTTKDQQQTQPKRSFAPRELFSQTTIDHTEIDVDREEWNILFSEGIQKKQLLCCRSTRMRKKDFRKLISLHKPNHVNVAVTNPIKHSNSTNQHCQDKSFASLFPLRTKGITQKSEFIRAGQISWCQIRQITNKLRHNGYTYYEVRLLNGQEIIVDALNVDRFFPEIVIAFFKKRINPFVGLQQRT